MLKSLFTVVESGTIKYADSTSCGEELNVPLDLPEEEVTEDSKEEEIKDEPAKDNEK